MDSTWIIRGLGLFFILLAFAIRTGYFKNLYWRSKGGIFGYLPMGLLFLWYAYYDQITQSTAQATYVFYLVFVVLIALTLWFALRTPQWAKPDWIKWVEKYPTHIRKRMAEEAGENKDWESLVVDEESVKKWARKLGGKK